MSRKIPCSRKFNPAVMLALLVAAVTAPSGRAAETFEGISVEVVGQGRPVLMIPGLSSGAEVWRETCAALQPQVQCHMVQLPGFAGLPPVKEERFLEGMRDRLLRYVQARGLRQPAVMGHSLGGVLALQMGIARPQAVGPLVIVDSLPFLPAAQNPAATVETVRPMVEGMRAQTQAADETAYRAQSDAVARSMVRTPERVGTVADWSVASNRATTAQAMYELMTTDLRGEIAAIRSPTLVLGAWAAYAPHGATLESTTAIFRTQYAGLEGVRVEVSQSGYHFLMWDDPQWLQAQVREFLALPATR
ncbi:alpha/beta fold hydrolase [Pseudoxanthomonas mexicana]|uniref:alpha/beta fold hydrolase n=1 Tax=Pseudoxanthomonas mexicana TaxID=128785 RepID=UPI00398B922E